jgi:arylsulfatase A-like enzyme
MSARVAALAAVAAVLSAAACGPDAERLPDRIRIPAVHAQLESPAQAAAVEAPPGEPVTVRGLMPSPGLALPLGWRDALVAPPPSRIAWRVAVPPDAALEFRVGVENDGKRDLGRSGVRFRVTLDGRDVWHRAVNPAASRHDRHWFDGHVDLGAAAGREVELGFHTEATEPGRPLAGAPGWSRVRVVHDTWRPRQPAAAGAPSVLFLLVDTLRADHVGVYGARPSPTPNLDAFAARARVYRRMISQAPWTMPAVATLLTGLHPRSHGVQGSRDGATKGIEAETAYLGSELATLPELALDAGVTTVGVSANPLVTVATNFAQGFESWVELEPRERHAEWPDADAVNDAFLAWLRRNREHRFFAYLHYMDPHDPYRPDDAHWPDRPAAIDEDVGDGDIRRVADRVNRQGGARLDPTALAYVKRLYEGEVRSWDAALPALLDGLRAVGRAESTVIVVTSDHGEEFQEHGRLVHGIHLYEELLHVPLLIAGPGIAPGPIDALAQTVDLFPTVATMLGLRVPAALPGQDLLGALAERSVISETRRGVAGDVTPAHLVSIRTPSHKLIWAPDLDHVELYDLVGDPAEQRSLGEAAEREPLLSRLAAWDPPAPPRAGEASAAGQGDEILRRLRAIGYVQ